MTVARILLGGALFAAASVAAAPAFAGAEALIALGQAGEDALGRAGRVQELLLGRLGFTKVEVLVNATADEIPGLIRAFVARPGEAGDRRLAWVSGPAAPDPLSPCPAKDLPTVTPPVATLVLAPACYGGLFPIGREGRRFAITTPVPGTDNGPGIWIELGRTVPRRTEVPFFAILTVPSDGPGFIDRGDAVVIESLARAESGISPIGLLEALRLNFREAGSGYTPTLEASVPAAAWLDVPAANERGALPTLPVADRWAGDPARGRHGAVDLRAMADPDSDPALRVPEGFGLRVLRHARDGRMAFVQADRRFYGWVKADELQ